MPDAPVRSNVGRAATLLSIFLAACVSTQAPQRPTYQGEDSVSVADIEDLTGRWLVTELNPYPDAPAQETIVEYLPNGQVIGTVLMLDEHSDLASDFSLTLTGEWTLDADVITHSNVNISTTDDDPLSHILADAFNRQPKLNSQANIMELESNRMVMLGLDGTAMEYKRQ